MNLFDVLQEIKDKKLAKDVTCANIEISGVTYNSKNVKPGYLFVCKGATFKREYLLSAVENGAVVYMSETDYQVNIPCILVTDIRKAMAYCAASFYGNPSDKLKIIGVTGTKGKTTTAFMVKSILDISKDCGIMTSVKVETGIRSEASTMTTPESMEMQEMLYEMVKSGKEFAVMEVSSQGLQYDRVLATNLIAGAFVNIGIDHISPIEHKDFKEYFDAKKKIFEYVKLAVINYDDEHSSEMIESAKNNGCNIITYGLNPCCDIYAYDIKKEGLTTKYRVKTKDWDEEFVLPMLGTFNVGNTLAAIGLCMEHVSVDDMKKGIASVQVPGRMNVFTDGELTVIVDYAHNKLSFETLIASLRKEFPGKRLISVFGCPGSKALVRRKDMGESSGRLSDFTVLTAEDPNYDDVEEINKEVARYITANGGKYTSVPDRHTAIKQTVLNADSNDVILILGKGEETYQRVNNGYVPYEGDIALAQLYLNQRKKV